MTTLNLPNYDYRLDATQTRIFDIIRKKYVVLTPEEWVRQHFVNYLITHLHYPATLIRVEVGVKYNQLAKRPDIIVFDREAHPLVLVECKSPKVRIDPDVFRQASVYNKVLKAPYLIATNGMEHYCSMQNYAEGTFEFVQEIPDYNKLIK